MGVWQYGHDLLRLLPADITAKMSVWNWVFSGTWPYKEGNRIMAIERVESVITVEEVQEVLTSIGFGLEFNTELKEASYGGVEIKTPAQPATVIFYRSQLYALLKKEALHKDCKMTAHGKRAVLRAAATWNLEKDSDRKVIVKKFRCDGSGGWGESPATMMVCINKRQKTIEFHHVGGCLPTWDAIVDFILGDKDINLMIQQKLYEGPRKREIYWKRSEGVSGRWEMRLYECAADAPVWAPTAGSRKRLSVYVASSGKVHEFRGYGQEIHVEDLVELILEETRWASTWKELAYITPVGKYFRRSWEYLPYKSSWEKVEIISRP